MQPSTRLPEIARRGLRRPLTLTRAGLLAERMARAFWPLWSICLAVLAALMLGVQDALPLELVWGLALVAGLGALVALVLGLRRFRWPSETDALVRLDESLPGRPITALSDAQAIGGTDAASRAIWEAHLARMADRIRAARAVEPDLRIAARDPFALRYVALLAFAVALLFGSFLRVGSVAQMGPGGPAMASGPSWEGWIEPPAYTGLPSLYLADLPDGPITVPEGADVTLRLYGAAGDLTVSETVSAAIGDAGSAAAPVQSFRVMQPGEIAIDGPGGRSFDVELSPDAPPAIEVTGTPERGESGEFRQPFAASDDYGVTGGQVEITLDMDAIDRRYGLAADPDPRDPLVVDLPLPISGDRSEFTGTLIENFSEHPWANLPVTLRYVVSDELGQEGGTGAVSADLAGLRYFDPMAKAVIEQRRDLLWARDNARRVAQILRAVSWRLEEAFRDQSLYLRLRVVIRRLESGIADGPLSVERQEEIAAELWDIAQELEYGDLADALERLRRAQERLSEAIENGADEAEIAELMQELREATQDYIRQLAEQSQGQEQQQAQGDSQQITGNQIQEMMDRIQELMEQGRMAEAQQLLEQLNRMMENMQVTQGGQGEPSPGEQAMQDMQQALRDQQELSDEAFRDLQEQFGQRGQQQGQQGQQGQQPGQQQGQQGQGQQGQQGQQPGQGQQQGQQQGQGGQQGQNGQQGMGDSLAQRQQALRDELRRQEGNLPGAGTEAGEAARDALDRAGRAMDGAEEALRERDYSRALDDQSEAMEALREGMRSLGEALAENQQQQQQGQGQGQATAEGDPSGRSRDPLGREAGQNGQMGSEEQMLGQEDVYRRAEELLDEIRRRSGEQARPEAERDYLRRLLDRF